MEAFKYNVQPGRYRHFKATNTKCWAMARHSEDRRGNGGVPRPVRGTLGFGCVLPPPWCETVERDGKVQPRFVRIEV
ncbi:MAG: DUF1653 domain-containing protein [Faecalibacterium prausnitzii]